MRIEVFRALGRPGTFNLATQEVRRVKNRDYTRVADMPCRRGKYCNCPGGGGGIAVRGVCELFAQHQQPPIMHLPTCGTCAVC
jgi:hypothetical protein